MIGPIVTMIVAILMATIRPRSEESPSQSLSKNSRSPPCDPEQQAHRVPDQYVAQHDRQRQLLLVYQVQHRLEEQTPHVHRREHADRGQDRLRDRQHDPGQHGQVVGAVQAGGLQQRVRYRLEVGADDDDVPDVERGGSTNDHMVSRRPSEMISR